MLRGINEGGDSMDLQVVEHRSLSLRDRKGAEAGDFPSLTLISWPLESSHSTGERTGGFKYICTYDGNLLVSCLILYEKNTVWRAHLRLGGRMPMGNTD